MVTEQPMTFSKPNFRDPRWWPRIHAATHAAPPEDPKALALWIHLLTVPTPHMQALKAAQAQLRLRHVGFTERWLAVSGESDLGKSRAITAIMLREAMASEEPWMNRRSDGSLHVPFVYIEVDRGEEAPGLMSAIAKFCGIPNSGNGRDLLDRLSEALPRVGTRLIVIDDARMLRRSSASASRLTDGLRTLLRLPVPILYIGIDLPASALLWDPGRNNDTVQQLVRRHDALHLNRLNGPEGVATVNSIVAAFARRLRQIPNFTAPGLTDRPLLSDLAMRSQGRPGTLFITLKFAAAGAALGDRILSAERIAAELPISATGAA